MKKLLQAKSEHNIPPQVQVPVHVLQTPALLGLKVKENCLLAALRDWRLAAYSLFWIVWAENSKPYCPANLNSWDAHFTACL